jgi:SAM-dependent methyltransferase
LSNNRSLLGIATAGFFDFAPMYSSFGNQTLNAFRKTERFNHWMFEQVLPYCVGPCLEVGSGLGNLSKHFLAQGVPLMLTDEDGAHCQALRQIFRDQPLVLGVEQVDICSPNLAQTHPQLLGQFQAVFALNVFEHLQDDGQALQNCVDCLASGGYLVLLVPAHPRLYNAWDEQLGHYRRYTAEALSALLNHPDLVMERRYAFNAAAMAGWWWYGKVLQRPQIPQQPLTWFDRLVPLWRGLDWLLLRRWGISWIAVARHR